MALETTKAHVFLTGAGSVLPWDAPKTEELTNIIRKDNTFRSYTGQPLGDWIYHRLVGLYYNEPEKVNFEAILNAVEYLTTFFYSKYSNGGITHKNVMPAFFEERRK